VPERSPFSYAIVRVVPRIERGECFNAGVILFCRQRGFLQAKVSLYAERLQVLAPGVEAEGLQAQLDAYAAVAAGDPAGGPMAALPASERFGWLVAPSSTVIQTSATHTGLSEDPAATLECLFNELVRTLP
jgi:hypothetical protein